MVTIALIKRRQRRKLDCVHERVERELVVVILIAIAVGEKNGGRRMRFDG